MAPRLLGWEGPWFCSESLGMNGSRGSTEVCVRQSRREMGARGVNMKSSAPPPMLPQEAQRCFLLSSLAFLPARGAGNPSDLLYKTNVQVALADPPDFQEKRP